MGRAKLLGSGTLGTGTRTYVHAVAGVVGEVHVGFVLRAVDVPRHRPVRRIDCGVNITNDYELNICRPELT